MEISFALATRSPAAATCRTEVLCCYGNSGRSKSKAGGPIFRAEIDAADRKDFDCLGQYRASDGLEPAAFCVTGMRRVRAGTRMEIKLRSRWAMMHRVQNALERIFGCWHRNVSRPFTISGRTYEVCLNCGRQFPYVCIDFRHTSAHGI
jgi:hypothetical protein